MGISDKKMLKMMTEMHDRLVLEATTDCSEPLKVVFMNVLFACFVLYTTKIKQKKNGHKGLICAR